MTTKRTDTKESAPRASGEATMSRADIERLIEVIHEKNVSEFELEQGGTKLRIVTGRAAAPVMMQAPIEYHPAPAAPAPVSSPASAIAGSASATKAPAAEDPSLKKVLSPMVGSFYRSPAPGAKSFIEIGDRVTEDSVLCIIEAMKLMNEIKAECRGVVRKALVENGQPVEYGQALFLIDPN